MIAAMVFGYTSSGRNLSRMHICLTTYWLLHTHVKVDSLAVGSKRLFQAESPESISVPHVRPQRHRFTVPSHVRAGCFGLYFETPGSYRPSSRISFLCNFRN